MNRLATMGSWRSLEGSSVQFSGRWGRLRPSPSENNPVRSSSRLVSPPKATLRQNIFKTLRGGILFLALVALGGGAYHQGRGDQRFPKLHSLQLRAPELQHLLSTLPTKALYEKGGTAEEYWEGLQPSLKILDAIAPEIAQWMREKHQQGKIQYTIPAWNDYLYKNIGPDNTDAMYNPLNKNVYLGKNFWIQTVGAQSTLIAHEYRHSTQNLPFLATLNLFKLFSGNIRCYPSPIEDKAYLYQAEAYRALDLPPVEIYRYMKDRDLLHLD